jgi:uncharacterized phage protein (TIGR02220 family)
MTTPKFELTSCPIEPLTIRQQAEIVLSFLNQKSLKNFRPVAVHIKMISARLKEGATVQDCKSIVALKCRQWRDDLSMKMYLRPATLFNRTNFWNYHGELE